MLKELEKQNKKEDEPKEKNDADKKKGNKKETEADKLEVKPIQVDLQGIQDRIVRLTPNSSRMTDAILSPDGENLYYLADRKSVV